MSTGIQPATDRNPVPMACDRCGHEWTTHSYLRRAEIVRESRKFTCPGCGKQCRYGMRPDTRPTRCTACKGPLNSYATEDLICGPCDETLQKKMDSARQPAIKDALEAERRQVLETLPGSLPVICQVSGVRWVDVARILGAAVKAGDVVQWNVPGFRPIYKLVADLGPEPEKSRDARRLFELRITDDEILGALPGTVKQICEKSGYSVQDHMRDRLRKLLAMGNVSREGKGTRHSPYVWHSIDQSNESVLGALPASTRELVDRLRFKNRQTVQSRMNVLRRKGLVRFEPRPCGGGSEHVWHRVEEGS